MGEGMLEGRTGSDSGVICRRAYRPTSSWEDVGSSTVQPASGNAASGWGTPAEETRGILAQREENGKKSALSLLHRPCPRGWSHGFLFESPSLTPCY